MKGQKGFTLIELLVVIAILGILAAVAIPNLWGLMGRGETEAAKTELSIVQTAVVAFMVENNGVYPDDVGDIAAYIVGGDSALGWNYAISTSGEVAQGAKK